MTVTVKVFAECCDILLRFWKSEIRRPRRDREERERARDPVAIVAKIGLDWIDLSFTAVK